MRRRPPSGVFRTMAGCAAIDTWYSPRTDTSDQQNPELSGIVLSQANLGENEDGYLRASELSAFDFRTDLVFISACRRVWASGCGAKRWVCPRALRRRKREHHSDPMAGARWHCRVCRTLLSQAEGQQTAECCFIRNETGVHPRSRPAKSRPVVWAPFVYYGD